jgi:hypothetical protein
MGPLIATTAEVARHAQGGLHARTDRSRRSRWS